MSLVQQVRAAGIVGAGGGGFPTYVKLSSKADVYIANGAECEPLLNKDAIIMERHPDLVIKGLMIAADAVGAKRRIIAIKEKKKEAIQAIKTAIKGSDVELFLLPDVYPSGDEYELVYMSTGRAIPTGGIPINVGVVVNNVETLYWIAQANEGLAVTSKYVTLAGAVHNPITVEVAIGTTIKELLPLAGGVTVENPVFFIGGLMMGQMTTDENTPITKTTTGIIVLARSHPISQRRSIPLQLLLRIDKSACDQCRQCTEYCPRYLLGYPVQPHLVMRSLAFNEDPFSIDSEWGIFCCGCGLCTLFACPEALFPKEACDIAKETFRKKGLRFEKQPLLTLHPMREGRRVPLRRLIQKLGVDQYDKLAPFSDRSPQANEFILQLKQGAGVAGRPIVRVGEKVHKGQPLTYVPDNLLGVPIHAPVDGLVTKITEQLIIVRR